MRGSPLTRPGSSQTFHLGQGNPGLQGGGDALACQGTVVDSTKVKVMLLAGWNTLLIKVYDQGGGWGNYARFLDGATPVTDLELSLSPHGAWAPDQTDSDKDGVGDVCDKTPR